jgi:hypothetical protein
VEITLNRNTSACLGYRFSRGSCFTLRRKKAAVPMTIDNQITDFLYARRGQVLCHQSLRRAAILPSDASAEPAEHPLARSKISACAPLGVRDSDRSAPLPDLYPSRSTRFREGARMAAFSRPEPEGSWEPVKPQLPPASYRQSEQECAVGWAWRSPQPGE